MITYSCYAANGPGLNDKLENGALKRLCANGKTAACFKLRKGGVFRCPNFFLFSQHWFVFGLLLGGVRKPLLHL